MKKISFPTLIILTIFLNPKAYSQEWRIYNMNNSGLPDDNISAITIDDNNNKWIGMNGGDSALVIFNDLDWTVFSTTDYWSTYDWVTKIIFDKFDKAWIATDGGGISKFDGSNWTVYNEATSGIPDHHIFDIVEDSSGAFWIATEFHGIVKYDGTTWHNYSTENSGLPNDTTMALDFDSDGNLWIGTLGGGLVKFDGKNWITYNQSNSGLPDDYIFCIIAVRLKREQS